MEVSISQTCLVLFQIWWYWTQSKSVADNEAAVLSLSFPPSDIFSMISDSSGVMVYGRYDMFLREVLKLPTAVFEGPSFGYTEQSAKSCFSQQVNEEVQDLNHPSEQTMTLPVLHIWAYLPRKHRAGWGEGALCWFLACRFGAFNGKLVTIGSPYNNKERGLVIQSRILTYTFLN